MRNCAFGPGRRGWNFRFKFQGAEYEYTCLHDLAAPSARSFARTLSLEKRGSRECRMRAAPAVSCAKLCEEPHTSIQVQRRHSGIPCAMALRLMPCSPRRRIRLVTVVSGLRYFVSPVGLEKPPPT